MRHYTWEIILVILNIWYSIYNTRYMIHCICYLIYDTWYLILDSDNHISYLTPCYWNLDTWILSLATCYLLTVTFLLILTGTCFFILFIWYLLLLAKRLYPFAPVARLALVSFEFLAYLTCMRFFFSFVNIKTYLELSFSMSSETSIHNIIKTLY